MSFIYLKPFLRGSYTFINNVNDSSWFLLFPLASIVIKSYIQTCIQQLDVFFISKTF